MSQFKANNVQEDLKLILERIEEFSHSEYVAEIPSVAVDLLVAGEDKRFFSHRGYDLVGIARSVWRYAFYSRIEGGSTIEQQLVRVLTNRYERTVRRKIREIILARQLFNRFDKVSIAKAYLFFGYYGWKMSGLEQVCMKKKKRVNQMNELELAHLIARLKYPEPRKYSEKFGQKIQKRVQHILTTRAVNSSTPTILELT